MNNDIKILIESIFDPDDINDIINDDESVLDKYLDNDKIYPGQILYYNVGWNCSIPCWARVISLTPSGKSCKIELLGKKLISGAWNSYGECMPVLDEEGEKDPHTYRIDKNKKCIKIDDYNTARVWDGKPKYYSTD